MAQPYSIEVVYDKTKNINNPMLINNRDTLAIKCTGTGSCVLQGRMTHDGDYVNITAINMNGFNTNSTINTEDIYVADVSSLYQIKFTSITGFTKIQVRLS